jgi:MSHA pilin protein MshA
MQQRGFTLIELIIVIVILGILAVTAAPRFIDLQSDARRASLEGVRAALQGGAQLVYAKAAIAGEQTAENANIDLDGDGNGDVVTDFGYPDANSISTREALAAWVDVDADTAANESTTNPDFRVTRVNATSFTISPVGTARTGTPADACQVVYTNGTATQAPTIELEGANC